MSEIEEQRELEIGGFEIGESLGHVNISNCIHSFHFDDYRLFNDDVQAVLPNDLIFVVDVDLLFCFCEKATEV